MRNHGPKSNFRHRVRRHRFRFCTSRQGFNQGKACGNRSGDAGGGHDIVIKNIALVPNPSCPGKISCDLVERVPMGGCRPSVEDAGASGYPCTLADGHDDCSLAGLISYPPDHGFVPAVMHRRHDNDVSTLRMGHVKCMYGRIRLDFKRGHQADWTGVRRDNGDIRNIRPLQYAIRHNEIGCLRASIISHNRNERPSSSGLHRRQMNGVGIGSHSTSRPRNAGGDQKDRKENFHKTAHEVYPCLIETPQIAAESYGGNVNSIAFYANDAKDQADCRNRV